MNDSAVVYRVVWDDAFVSEHTYLSVLSLANGTVVDRGSRSGVGRVVGVAEELALCIELD